MHLNIHNEVEEEENGQEVKNSETVGGIGRQRARGRGGGGGGGGGGVTRSYKKKSEQQQTYWSLQGCFGT